MSHLQNTWQVERVTCYACLSHFLGCNELVKAEIFFQVLRFAMWPKCSQNWWPIGLPQSNQTQHNLWRLPRDIIWWIFHSVDCVSESRDVAARGTWWRTFHLWRKVGRYRRKKPSTRQLLNPQHHEFCSAGMCSTSALQPQPLKSNVM